MLRSWLPFISSQRVLCLRGEWFCIRSLFPPYYIHYISLAYRLGNSEDWSYETFDSVNQFFLINNCSCFWFPMRLLNWVCQTLSKLLSPQQNKVLVYSFSRSLVAYFPFNSRRGWGKISPVSILICNFYGEEWFYVDSADDVARKSSRTVKSFGADQREAKWKWLQSCKFERMTAIYNSWMSYKI